MNTYRSISYWKVLCSGGEAAMKAVYSSPQLLMVVHFKNLLENAGIESRIKNEYLAGGAGELPPNECWPILLVEDGQYQRAKRFIEEQLHSPDTALAAWICPHCGEENEGQFALCWHCGNAADDLADDTGSG